MKYPILSGINSPDDIKNLNHDEIKALSAEIREFLVENAEIRGGHLASNLGVVELTLAIHTVFDSPIDRIIFDVGHQSYVHKLITGRREMFDTLRTPGGLSGFTSMRESKHDPFGAGHSSTSLSAAIGIAESDRLYGLDCYTVCVAGDGAFTGGMMHEALNNCSRELPIVLILNENGMSISSTKGAFASYLSRVRVSHGYRKLRDNTKDFVDKIPLVGRHIHTLCSDLKDWVKKSVYKPNYFEELGLYYIGPIDGHDYGKICKALELAKQMKKACVVHVKTVKGKGYAPAELSPDDYHSFGNSDSDDSFHSVFVDNLISLANYDDNIVGVTAAMGIGTGLERFGNAFPERYFDVGIAEPHALTFSAGLAAGGHTPFVTIYSTFLQRGYDSLLHDIALQNLPVKLMIDRAGLAVGDGATHHGIFDVSFISHIPGLILLAPISYASLGEMTRFSADYEGPVAIRYPNSKEHTEYLNRFRYLSRDCLCRISTDFDVSNPPDNIYITYGNLLNSVCDAADILRSEGMKVGVICIETIKPYEQVAAKLLPIISLAKRVVYAEEGIRNGGAAEITLTELISLGLDLNKTEYRIAAIEDNFASPDTPCDLYDYVGLSKEKLKETMKN